MSVYPGHPITIAVQIFRSYPRIREAFEKTSSDGVPNALTNSDVHGAGGNVYRGLRLVQTLLQYPHDFDTVVEEGFRAWDHQLSVPLDVAYHENMEPGNVEARALLDELKTFVEKNKDLPLRDLP